MYNNPNVGGAHCAQGNNWGDGIQIAPASSGIVFLVFLFLPGNLLIVIYFAIPTTSLFTLRNLCTCCSPLKTIQVNLSSNCLKRLAVPIDIG